MFDKLKQMNELRKWQAEAKKVQKELEKTHVEAEVDGVIVIINGKQEVQSIHIPEDILKDGEKLEKTVVKAFNKALSTSQKIGAEKMKGIMGGLGLPGV